MKIPMLIGFSLCLGIAANDSEAVSAPGQFNLECPAKRLCPDLEKHYRDALLLRNGIVESVS